MAGCPDCVGCTGYCTGCYWWCDGCSDECSGCYGDCYGCTGTCSGGCVGGCQSGCTGCTTTCGNNCGNGCASSSLATAYNKISGGFSNIIYSSEIIALRDLAANEATRRGQTAQSTNVESVGHQAMASTFTTIIANTKKADSSFSLTPSTQMKKSEVTTVLDNIKTLYAKDISH